MQQHVPVTMMLRSTLIVFIALSLGLASGCGESEPTDNPGMSSNDEEMGGEPNAVESGEGRFEMGYNVVYQNTPESFTVIEDGAAVPLIWGVQGSWMVVLGFRSQNLVEGAFDIRAEITIDGVESGEIWYELQETFPGGNGWDYYYNLFLAIDQNDPFEAGTPATIQMSVEDEAGNAVEASHEVVIGETVGGP